MATHYEVLQINQGTDASIELHLVDINNSAKDLTGHTITAKLGTHYDARDSDKTTFVSIVSQPATSGIVNLSLTNVITTGSTIVERIMEGIVTITPSVTT